MPSTRGWEGLPNISQALYKETYFLPNEDYSGWLNRISTAYQNDSAHALRMSTYISNYWFHPSTPPSSNAGTDRGLPISCFTGSVADSKEGIFDSWTESCWLGANGGGVGKDWTQVREINHKVGGHGGTSSGIIPFMKVNGSLSNAISQGGNRRYSEANYLHISHPEIEEFIDIRRPTGDQSRRAPDLHHAVVIPDSFMEALINGKPWHLVSPKDGTVVKTVQASALWTQIMEVRATQTGEPYLMFESTVNRLAPPEYISESISITTSNLCTEITLRTDDQHTGVCCLGSVNLEYYDEWKDDELFLADCSDFLDNILQDFINRTLDKPGFEKSRRSAIDERSIGLGVMGLHSLFQKRNIPWETPMAKGLNREVFNHIKTRCDEHNISSATTVCHMAQRNGSTKRNIHVTAIAPTMSISNLCNLASGGIEPWVTNAFTKKLKQGSFPVRNKFLAKFISDYAKRHGLTAVSMDSSDWIAAQWASIMKYNGSVQHLDWMDDWTKDVFKTAFEMDQAWLIEFAGDRAPLIDQGQSLNLFIPGGSHVQTISDIHILAWKRGVKTLYYLRSSAVNRGNTSSNERKHIQPQEVSMETLTSDTCIGCA